MSASISRVNSTDRFVPDIDRTIIAAEFGAMHWEQYFPEIEVIDEAVEYPRINWLAEDPFFKRPYYENYCLLYIPKEVILEHERQIFTVELLEKMLEKVTTKKVEYDDEGLGRYILMSKNLLPNTEGLDYGHHRLMVQSQGFYIPTVLEALALSMMVYKATKEHLFTDGSTRCQEISGSFESVYVGGDGWGSFHIQVDAKDIGAIAPVVRF